jgi:hypothetical protein
MLLFRMLGMSAGILPLLGVFAVLGLVDGFSSNIYKPGKAPAQHAIYASIPCLQHRVCPQLNRDLDECRGSTCVCSILGQGAETKPLA